MHYYLNKNQLFISLEAVNVEGLVETNEAFAKTYAGTIYALTSLDPALSRRAFIVASAKELFIKKEDLSLLTEERDKLTTFPLWLEKAISEKRVISLNMEYPNFKEAINKTTPAKWRVHVVGLGDVGATLLTGLRLLGAKEIETLGIYDLDKNKMKRLHFELNQILSCDGTEGSIQIEELTEKDLFNCDLFVFCVSVGIPPVGSKGVDVRLIQFEGNRKILKNYGLQGRKANYKGLFAVVSDPVDLLCMSLFEDSNKNEEGNFDFLGLAPEQIKGYGLGVMNARAAYFSQDNPLTMNYLKEGRAFGPHGEGLVIANSIINYDEAASKELTKKTKEANLMVRDTGYKPYIAPALSSGALSLLDTIRGNFHYSSNFLGGVYMGSKNRFLKGCTENEVLPLPEGLMKTLEETYVLLKELMNKNQ